MAVLKYSRGVDLVIEGSTDVEESAKEGRGYPAGNQMEPLPASLTAARVES